MERASTNAKLARKPPSLSPFGTLRRDDLLDIDHRSSSRQLEAMVRISESLAKMRLAPFANEADVDEALRLFHVSTLSSAGSGNLAGKSNARFNRFSSVPWLVHQVSKDSQHVKIKKKSHALKNKCVVDSWSVLKSRNMSSFKISFVK